MTPPRTLYILRKMLECVTRQKEEAVDLLRPKGSETIMDVVDRSLGKFWINGGECVAADLLVIRAGKVPRELDGGLLHDLLGRWLEILHLNILDGDGEGLEAEAKGLGRGWLHLALLDVLNVSLLVGDKIGGRGKVSGDAGPSTAGGILEGCRNGSELHWGDVLG